MVVQLEIHRHYSLVTPIDWKQGKIQNGHEFYLMSPLAGDIY